ncbi:hypothetical protein L2E82_24620 [Cichorium intybus]|uniref:Uncharacterized protein n=1 Tax=Cichorium intybus TaxID=13427 RepID=A0ACB9E1J2_CICIN|nr:hypothetical protein L2E82_24620 [Cichorium intybus]
MTSLTISVLRVQRGNKGSIVVGRGEHYSCEICYDINSQLISNGCILCNTEYIVGTVIFTGHETKVMMNAMNVPSKRSTLERKLDKVIATLFGYEEAAFRFTGEGVQEGTDSLKLATNWPPTMKVVCYISQDDMNSLPSISCSGHLPYSFYRI